MKNTPRLLACIAGTWLALASAGAHAQTGTFQIRVLTPETALKAVNAALAECRKGGYQVAVAVVDRSGLSQAMLRDRFAGAHTAHVATDKAWTAVSFRSNTTDLARLTQPGQASSGLRSADRVMAVGGGVIIEAGGSIVGGIGVSGAPSGDADDACAKAGIASIRDELEL